MDGAELLSGEKVQLWSIDKKTKTILYWLAMT